MQVHYSLSTFTAIDAETCVSRMKAKLQDSETDKELATCEVYLVDFWTGQQVTDCHDLLDVDGVTYEFVVLFEANFELIDDIAEKLDHYYPIHRLVVIHDLKVQPEHRGKKLSNTLITDIERRFLCDTDLLALKAFPMENRTPETTESLSKYYESIGFLRTGVNDILAKPQI
ncbi:hypothetical protein [Vibrio parahaemolyticus]|uniref:hypothetical protein n=1 Tax=Vibrio parahaemolyticus TaxID=670 RepID=UPI003D816E85